MIRFIAAIDLKLGIADGHGIPWHGKVPTDVHYYHEKIKGCKTIMGYGMYLELSKPLVNPTNYVASSRAKKLRGGFILVQDVRKFLLETKEDVWVLGGAILFSSTLDLANELYLTRLNADFHCTKFFPKYEQNFNLSDKSKPITENGITFTFEIWKRQQRKMY